MGNLTRAFVKCSSMYVVIVNGLRIFQLEQTITYVQRMVGMGKCYVGCCQESMGKCSRCRLKA